MRYLLVVFTLATAIVASNAQAQSSEVMRCIGPAAAYHTVNAQVLQSIIRIESHGNPRTVTRNKNGSIDVGLGGTNSVHFKELATFGVAPSSLLDACISTYTTAWLLAKAVHKYGETWQGVASFHSTSPYYNARYQILIHNDMVRRGAKAGTLLPVPPLLPATR